jgi:hypothetical protein
VNPISSSSVLSCPPFPLTLLHFTLRLCTLPLVTVPYLVLPHLAAPYLTLPLFSLPAGGVRSPRCSQAALRTPLRTGERAELRIYDLMRSRIRIYDLMRSKVLGEGPCSAVSSHAFRFHAIFKPLSYCQLRFMPHVSTSLNAVHSYFRVTVIPTFTLCASVHLTCIYIRLLDGILAQCGDG